MTVIYAVRSLQFTKEYCHDGSRLLIQTQRDDDMMIEHCISVKHYKGTHLEYDGDETPIYFVITLKYTELRFVFSKPVDLVRVYSTEIAKLMGF